MMSVDNTTSPVVTKAQVKQLRLVLDSQRGLLLQANFRAALRALQANGMRSFLTMLGVIIGVAAVITAITQTEGVSANINQRMSSLGANILTVLPGPTKSGGIVTIGAGSGSTLTLADMQVLSTIDHVVQVSPIVNAAGQAIFMNQNWNTDVQGVYPDYLDMQSLLLAEGTWFSESDERAGSPNVVIGATVAEKLFGPTGVDPVGQSIRFKNQTLHVVGVLQIVGAEPKDDVIYMPFSVVQHRLTNTNFVSRIDIEVDNVNNAVLVKQDLEATLRKRHHIAPSSTPTATGGENAVNSGKAGNVMGPGGGMRLDVNSNDDFMVIAPSQFIQAAQANASSLATLLISIAAISLTVGGIGIMNIMLVSVTERTREIGIRMAVGARKSDVRNQFLIEATLLSGAGGVLGILFGLFAGFEMVSSSQLPFVLDFGAMLLAVGIAGGIGILFGLYPAMRASDLDPIVALRTQ